MPGSSSRSRTCRCASRCSRSAWSRRSSASTSSSAPSKRGPQGTVVPGEVSRSCACKTRGAAVALLSCMRALQLVVVTGCAGDVAPVLTVEPQAIDLTVALGKPPAPVQLHVYTGSVEITGAMELDGAPHDSVVGGVFASYVVTGGGATVRITVGGRELTVPTTVHIVGWRIELADIG